MGERIGNSFRSMIAAVCALAVLALTGAFVLLRRSEVVDGAVVAAVTFFLFRLFWRATQRKRHGSRSFAAWVASTTIGHFRLGRSGLLRAAALGSSEVQSTRGAWSPR